VRLTVLLGALIVPANLILLPVSRIRRVLDNAGETSPPRYFLLLIVAFLALLLWRISGVETLKQVAGGNENGSVLSYEFGIASF